MEVDPMHLDSVQRFHSATEERRPVLVVGEIETDSARTAVLLDIGPHVLAIDEAADRGQSAVRIQLSGVSASGGVPQPEPHSVVWGWSQHIGSGTCRTHSL